MLKKTKTTIFGSPMQFSLAHNKKRNSLMPSQSELQRLDKRRASAIFNFDGGTPSKNQHPNETKFSPILQGQAHADPSTGSRSGILSSALELLKSQRATSFELAFQRDNEKSHGPNVTVLKEESKYLEQMQGVNEAGFNMVKCSELSKKLSP